ncbi:MAG: hypothetical protein U1E05_00170, partial [Patescibacteria group bacterium]|nr:hypothetical protein [Patescibacteria group bacterium]
KFRVQESYVGSWKAILAGTHRAFAFAKDKLGAFFAVLAGKGERLAEAYVQEKEAAATHATEKARQEQIETLSRAMALANKLGQQLAESRQDFPGDRKGVLIQQFLISPMEQMAHILLENGLTLDVSSKSADTGATGAQVE